VKSVAYNLENVIINLKKEIAEAGGGSDVPAITNTTLKSVSLLQQTTINESLSQTFTEPAYLVVSMSAMTGSTITLTLNGFSLIVESGYYKNASAFLPVYPDDELVFACESEGSDENLILNIMLIDGLTVPEKPTPSTNEK
jgi:hypothetical protein